MRDAIHGDPSLFTLDESVEAAWQVVEPIFHADARALKYEPGTWGPAAAAAVMHDGDAWHDPQTEASQPC